MSDAGAHHSLVPGALNFRDTGGLRAAGGVTRSGVLFRSGNLARLQDDGRQAVTALGVRRIIDLRADDEVTREPSAVSDIPIQRVPLFLGSVASFFTEDRSLDEMYDALVDDSADRVVEVVRGVLADQPVLVHCTVGKDRTGVTVALTLAAAGVAEDAVIADYALTETLLPPERNRWVMGMLRSAHPESRHLEDLATRSPAPVMRRLFGRLHAEYGSPTDYLRAHGVTDDEVTELRRVLVAGD